MTKRVLIIDDDEDFGELLVQRLEHDGLDVSFQHGAFGGSLARMRNGYYALVVLDVNMPGLSGVQMLELLRSSEARRVRVLLCSSMDPRPLYNLALDHDADDSISKSATGPEFVAKVRSLLGLDY